MLHKRNQRLLALIMALFLALPLAAACAQEPQPIYCEVELYQEGHLPEGVQAAPKSDFESWLLRQLNGLAAELDVSAYGYTLQQFNALYRGVINDHPELFYVSAGFYCYLDGDIVTTVQPIYLGDVEELPARIAAFNDKLNTVVAYAKRAKTTVGRLLLANDYFCANYAYDTTGSIYSAEGFFSTGTGVCQAYSLAFQAVLDKLGIENTTAASRDMNHMWNVVKVDGSWYHVDVTWNDPISSQPLKAVHRNFLRSDAAITAENHYGWTTGVTCSSTRFDAYPWLHAEYPLSMIGDVFYFTKKQENTVYACDLASNAAVTPLFTYQPTAGYAYGYACPVWVTENYIYYTTFDRLTSYHRTTGATAVLHRYTGTQFPLITGLFPGGGKLRVGEYETSSIISVAMEVPDYRLSITNGPLVMRVGDTAAVYTSVSPAPMELPAIAWTVSDPSVATVRQTIIADAEGAFCNGTQVTATGLGAATLTGRLSTGRSASCRIIVRGDAPLALPAGLTSLGAESLQGTGAVEIIVPEGVKEIGSRTFADCPGLQLVELPGGLTAIAADAFSGTDALLLCPAGSATETLLKNGGWPYIAY